MNTDDKDMELVNEIVDELILEEVKETLPEPVLTPEQQKSLKALHVFHAGRIFKGGLGKVGSSKVGVTRANKKLSKKAEKTAKNSRKISRGNHE